MTETSASELASPRHLSPCERAALADFVGRARALLGEELLDVRLFGSRARGEGGEGSDLDVALIVTSRGRRLRREVHGLTFDTAFDHGVEVEPLVIAEEQLRELVERELALGAILEREAIRL